VTYKKEYLLIWPRFFGIPNRLIVRSTARHALHLQFDISANALDIRVVQSPKCIVWCAVDCTYRTFNKTKAQLQTNWKAKMLLNVSQKGFISYGYLCYVQIFIDHLYYYAHATSTQKFLHNTNVLSKLHRYKLIGTVHLFIKIFTHFKNYVVRGTVCL
jgi:hypothetical protein